MAFRDTWHRTLVYFGLAEDEPYEEDLEPYPEPEADLENSYREQRNVRRLSARWECPVCRRVYNTISAPSRDGSLTIALTKVLRMPLGAGAQVAPPSRLLNTPFSVPA